MVMWRFRTGRPWRTCPAAEYGPWSRVLTGSARARRAVCSGS
ncbi:MAG: hypothetical protein HOZ81_33360 [Streptomyces sp.]|nr:hypothetical protein [Streptomyces sp.]